MHDARHTLTGSSCCPLSPTPMLPCNRHTGLPGTSKCSRHKQHPPWTPAQTTRSTYDLYGQACVCAHHCQGQWQQPCRLLSCLAGCCSAQVLLQTSLAPAQKAWPQMPLQTGALPWPQVHQPPAGVTQPLAPHPPAGVAWPLPLLPLDGMAWAEMLLTPAGALRLNLPAPGGRPDCQRAAPRWYQHQCSPAGAAGLTEGITQH